jgi:hypothetical protein
VKVSEAMSKPTMQAAGVVAGAGVGAGVWFAMRDSFPGALGALGAVSFLAVGQRLSVSHTLVNADSA